MLAGAEATWTQSVRLVNKGRRGDSNAVTKKEDAGKNSAIVK